MRGAIALATVWVAFVAQPAIAQVGDASSAPRRGTAQRTAILNAVRPSVERELGAPVEFLVTCMQVSRGQALVNLQPQRRGGRPIDRRIISDWQNRDGLTVTALLHFRDQRWRLVEQHIGATDVWYQGMVPDTLLSQPCS